MKYFFILLFIFIIGCANQDLVDDSVEPRITILNPIVSINTGVRYTFEVKYLNYANETLIFEGMKDVSGSSIDKNNVSLLWKSNNENILQVNNGVIEAITGGSVKVSVSATVKNNLGQTITIEDSDNINVIYIPPVVINTTTSGNEITTSGNEITTSGNEITTSGNEINTNSGSGVVTQEMSGCGGMITGSYGLGGNFSVTEQSNGSLLISLQDNFRFRGAPGPFLYLSNSTSSISDGININAGWKGNTGYNGVYNFTISGVEINQYRYLVFWCGPFRTRLGSGEISCSSN